MTKLPQKEKLLNRVAKATSEKIPIAQRPKKLQEAVGKVVTYANNRVQSELAARTKLIKDKIKLVEKAAQDYETQKKFDLALDVEKINESMKFKKDLDEAMDTVKKAVRLASIIVAVQKHKREKLTAKGVNNLQKAVLIKRINETTGEIYAEYMQLRGDMQKASSFVARAVKELQRERTINRDEIVVERNTILPLLNQLEELLVETVGLVTGSKEQVREYLKAA